MQKSKYHPTLIPKNFTENTPLLIESDSFSRSASHDPNGSLLGENRSINTKKTWRKVGKSVCLFSTVAAIITTLAVVAVFSLADSANNQILQSTNKASVSEDEQSETLIEIPQGKLRGYTLKSREGRNYHAFYKVPYAKSPTGNLRFKPPQPAVRWEEDIRDFREVAPQCIQKSKYSPILEAVGKEDCLYLNIYTPKLPGDGDNDQEFSLMPSLFYIHGGGFTDGNGSRYGAKYFMDENVLLITFQYRLGPFGFLSTGDDDILGNMAFKDQVMALNWVQENIKYFGGDSRNLMIFGNSAGAFSVSNLMISPMAKNLFQSAITQSGGALCSTMISSQETEKTLNSLAEEVGCFSKSRRRLLDCLEKQDAKDLAVVRTPDIKYGLTVEHTSENDLSNIFMPDTLYNMLTNGRVNKVPWIIGVNSAEFVHQALGYLKDPQIIEDMNSNWTETAPELLNYGGISSDEISTKAKDFYFGKKIIGNETITNLSNIVSDRSFVHCSKVQALIQAKYSDVFLYYLSKAPAKSYADKAKVGFPPGDYGVAHADELQFLFPYYGYPEYPVESEYYPFSRLLVKIWAQFAATRKPYSLNGINWETVKPGETPLPYFELNENPHPTTVLQSRMEFWDQFSHKDLHYN